MIFSLSEKNNRENDSYEAGFTMIEMVLVVVIVVFIAGIITPWGSGILRDQDVESNTKNFTTVLRRAQKEAVSQKFDSSSGVRTFTDHYIVFKGDSYSGRDQSRDERHNLAGSAEFRNNEEVVFSAPYGEVSSPVDIVVESGESSSTVSINEVGKVEVQ